MKKTVPKYCRKCGGRCSCMSSTTPTAGAAGAPGEAHLPTCRCNDCNHAFYAATPTPTPAVALTGEPPCSDGCRWPNDKEHRVDCPRRYMTDAGRVGMLEALRYIDEVCVSLEPGKNAAYLGALRDVRVSIAASIERLRRGGWMESTSDLMGTAPTDAGRVGVLERLLKRASDYLETANQIIIEDAGGDEEDFRDADELVADCRAALAGTPAVSTQPVTPTGDGNRVRELERALWIAKQWAYELYHHEGDLETTRARVAKLWEAIIQVRLPVNPPAADSGATPQEAPAAAPGGERGTHAWNGAARRVLGRIRGWMRRGPKTCVRSWLPNATPPSPVSRSWRR
jgi:hypothetical protein